jgi:DNA polymerase III delta prime subunit
MIHAFTGPQGTGKTVAAYDYAAILSKENPGKTVKVVSDVERCCPYPINREATREAQEWIFYHQIAAELNAMAHYDLVVTDRTIMDVIAYSMAAGFRLQADGLLAVWRKHSHWYKKIVFRHARTNCFNVEDGCRDTDPVFRARIEATLYELYKYEGVTTQARFSEL